MPAGGIEARIQGEVSGQVAVGNNIVQFGSVHGGVIYVAPPEARAAPRARPVPVLLRPRPFAGLLDRQAEVLAAKQALASSQTLHLHGPDGVGKTCLLRHLAHDPEAASLPDGIVYLSAGRHPLPDLMQLLFEAFYESELPLKPTEVQIQHALQAKRALVFIDDGELEREGVEQLLDLAPACVFLLASSERRLWGEVRPLALRGLPMDAALALLERALERPLSPEEEPAARSLCTALDGHPLRLLQAAALVRDEGRDLAAVARQLSAAAPVEALAQEALAGRSEPERRVLAALAALGGAAVRAEHLQAIAELPDVERVLESLLRRGLVESSRQRYRLAGSLAEELRKAWDLTPLAERALAYFAGASGEQVKPERLAGESDALLRLLSWAVGSGRWREALRLGRRVESALALGLRWGAWGQVLEWSLQAARALGDRAAEAGALHESGTRALCLDERAPAREALLQALQIRESLGDVEGAAVTRHNLDLLLGPLPQPEEPRATQATAEPAAPPPIPPVHPAVPLAVKAGLALLALGVAVVIGLKLWSPGAPVQALALSPGRLEFGEEEVVDLGRGEAHAPGPTRRLTVTNGARQTLRLTGMSIAGEAARDFRVLEDGCTNAVLERDGSCSIEIGFRPTAAGARSARLSLLGDVPAGSPRVLLAGAGIPPRASEETGVETPPSPPSVPGVSPGSLNFGDREVLTESAPQTVSLTNPGPQPLAVRNVALSGEAARDFRLDARACATEAIAPQASCTLEVRFFPTAAGARSALLEIAGGVPESRQTVPLTGTGIPTAVARVDVSPPGLSFGELEIEKSSPPRAVTIANSGAVPVRVRRVAVAGEQRGDFKIAGETCTARDLLPKASCSIRISFAPRAPGARRASLTIRNSAPDSLRSVTLGGTGIGAAGLALDPARLDFGAQAVGAAAAGKAKLRNSGSGPLSIRSIYLSGADSMDFRVAEDCSDAPLAAGGACLLQVRFVPSAPGKRSATLVVASNAPGSPHTLLLGGTGTGAPALRASPEALDFGSQEVGSEGGARSVTVTNAGRAPLTVGQPQLGGRDRQDFRIAENGCGAEGVAPQASCTIALGFAPRAAGPRSASLTLPANSPEGRHDIRLGGTGVPVTAPEPEARLEVDPARIDFGDRQPPGTRSPGRKLKLVNRGSGPLAIRSIEIGGPDRTDFELSDLDDCLKAALAPNRSCSVKVRFAPSTAGSRTASVTITGGAGGSPRSVPLTGTAPLLGVARVRPGSVDFGSHEVGTRQAVEVSLANEGPGPLNVGDIGIADSYLAAGLGQLGTENDFVLDSTTCGRGPLAAGQACVIVVAFTPQAPGTHDAVLRIVDDARDSPQLVSLKGIAPGPGPDDVGPAGPDGGRPGGGGLPDLVVTSLALDGPVTRDPEGGFQVPVRVVVRNAGGAPADVFKVSTEHEQGVVPFTSPGQADSFYPYTKGLLGLGKDVTFRGVVKLVYGQPGQKMRLRALADSCSGDEFTADFCRVKESDERNNESRALDVALPLAPPPGIMLKPRPQD